MIEEYINRAILILLAISTLVQILNWMGFLPSKFRKLLKLNQAEDTIEVLKDMGIDIDRYKRVNAIVELPVDYPEDIKKETEGKMKELELGIKVSVGKHRSTKLNYYIDLIGHSCEPKCAELYARLLCTYWSQSIRDGIVKSPTVDFIVTPKEGSPILGYEFSKLLEKPLVLHEREERFFCNREDMRKNFDCAQKPSEGSCALIVDDSTTGGRMVISAIKDLRKYGYCVTDCLVVFEPQEKDARQKLSAEGVNLISIVKTHI